MKPQDTYPFAVELAARHLACRPDELVDWKLHDDRLVVIAPDGRKFTYTVDQVRAMVEEFPDLMVTPPAVGQAAPGGPAPDPAPVVTPPLVTPRAAIAGDIGEVPSPKQKAAKRPATK